MDWRHPRREAEALGPILASFVVGVGLLRSADGDRSHGQRRVISVDPAPKLSIFRIGLLYCPLLNRRVACPRRNGRANELIDPGPIVRRLTRYRSSRFPLHDASR